MTRLGPFELRERIGVGGMGEVWRASHPDGGEVAVKTVAGGGSTEAWRARFRREVQAVAALEHPAIVAVLDANTTDESTWLAMELVTGGTLATNAPADWEGIRAVLLRLLSGLAHAHARGIVHRDLKPSNVLFGGPDDARPGWKLADFGIAHRAEQSDTDAYHGSPSFMAPEQVRGLWRSFGPWTDLYSLGCIAWQLLTGEPPFTGPTVEVAYGHLTLEPGRLPRGTVAVPGMDAWLARCLAKHPSQRFQRAEDAARQLRSTGDPAAVEVVGLPTSLPAPAEPEPKAVLGVGLGLYALRTRRIVGRDLEQRRLW